MLRSNGLYFHRFRPRFALFPAVGTGRIDVARGLVSASVVSRGVAVNSSRIKESDGAIVSVHSSAAEIFAKPRAVGTARMFEFHRPWTTSANLVRLEVQPSHMPLEQGFRGKISVFMYVDSIRVSTELGGSRLSYTQDARKCHL
ncbi:hypothetical protein AVEN_46015-1 [Araneus ventricosus]|uniref:Uncharacterized protein n=1 Tax=Araneus ventricosus TaxID=182803 RepID=A0A4Y2F830_ARAVE|nr:hypothetical protein AVEN_46015-1 [Araneus ventricosus]